MRKHTGLFVLTVLAFVFSVSSIVNADDQTVAQRILDEKSPAIVTVKCVVKIKSGRNDQEMESENSGVMIDPKGLVLCSNSRLGGAIGLYRRLMGAGASGVSITPTDIKIIVGDAADGVDAKFVARDSELDLAWIQIKQPGDKPYAFVDLNKSATPKVGQEVYSVYRTSKNFDRTAIVMENMVGGTIKKPRELQMAGDLTPALGLPAFAADGRVSGVSILQIPDGDDDESGQRVALNRMANSQEYSGALLPISEVLKATVRAKESAASEPASEESADDKSTTKPAKTGKKPDGEKKTDEEK